MAISEQVEQMERDDLEDFAVTLYENFEDRLDKVEDIAQDAHTTATDVEDRVADLEDEATVEMRGDKKYKNIFVDDLPFGTRFDSLRDEVEETIDRVVALENDEVDVSDIIDGTCSDDQLPIQHATDARKKDMHDFDGNKLRATYVWPKFNKRSKPDGTKLTMYSWQVKQILDDNNLDTNPNTVRRTMEFVAKLTSEKPKDERDPKDEDNLVVFNNDGAENTLVANKDEWEEFFSNQIDASLNGTDAAEDGDEDTTADDATDNVDEDVVGEEDALMAASAVTSSDDDDVTDEAGIEVTR